ncbi:transcriptional regulator [Streptomyces sp. NPDC050546]|uniref:transcriptional regulator n=1 Tax=Streptomyces sp. NPDC050546 TaxID=3365628 RepID=UPI0037BA70C3
MTRTARDLLRTTATRLAPDPRSNPLVPRISHGTASRTALAALALEQSWVIPADRRAFLHLAERSLVTAPEAAAFFRGLAEGEALAEELLPPLAQACGVDDATAESYEPLAGCQAYPAYVAWLSLNGSPADVVLALTANFSAWGGYCATITKALRAHYAFTDEACAFFDLFAEPSPDLDERAEAAVQAGLDTGSLDESRAHQYGRLLQAYEADFWNALSAIP